MKRAAPNRSLARRGYDRLAPWYAWIEWLRFGASLRRAREALIADIPPARRVLFVGEGDGRLVSAFVRRQPAAEITSVDISGEMVSLQRRRLAHSMPDARVQWIQRDVRHTRFPANHFDLLVTPFFLDCFTEDELGQLIGLIARWLTPRGHWYVVDFCYPSGRLRRIWASAWLAVMHAFFRWQTGLESRTLVDPEPILGSLGFTSISRQKFHGEMVQSVLYRRRRSTP